MYSAWAKKRRFQYEFIIGSILLTGLGIFLYIALHKPPSCFDNKQNQQEIGVDCGGECSARCAFEVQDVQILWTRPFPVATDFWNAVAYVENPNFDSYVEALPYRFLVYDDKNVLILEKKGSTFISGDPVVPVFSGGLDVGSRVPRRAVFEWLAAPYWQRMGTKPNIEISGQRLTPSDTVQVISATLHNREVRELRDVEVTAIVYGKNTNAIAASQTLVEFIGPLGSEEITWTWPQPFAEEVGRIELIPRVPVSRF